MLSVEVSFDVLSDRLRAGEWDDVVETSPFSGVMQTNRWASFKRHQGLQCLHIMVCKGRDIVGGAYFYSSRNRKGLSILVAPEGPVLPFDDEGLAEESLELILQECERIAPSLGAMAVRMEPRLPEPGPAFMSQFARSPSDLIPKETLLLDISKDERAILASMKHKCRYNIALAERKGVVVVEDSTPAAVRKFYSIMKEASARDRFALEPLTHFEQLIESLAPHTARLLFAEHEGTPLGTLLLVTARQRATYLYGGIINAKRNLMGGYALQWEAMRVARKTGCTVYDFFGFDRFMSPGNPYARFSQFKNKFGGYPVRYIGGHDHFFLDRLADAVIAVFKEVEDAEPANDPAAQQDGMLSLPEGANFAMPKVFTCGPA